MTLDRKRMGGMSFIVARGARAEPLIEPPRLRRAFLAGLAFGGVLGVFTICAAFALLIALALVMPA